MASYVKFMRGTPTAWEKYTSKDSDTLYFISEADSSYGELYIGEKLVTSSVAAGDIISKLSDLTDVDAAAVADGQVLSWDASAGKWVPTTIEAAAQIDVMVGAGDIEAGQAGLVPAPAAGDNDKFLRGDGTWAAVDGTIDPESYYTKAEVDTAITNAIAQADHLKREVVTSTDDIDLTKDNVIFMVPSGSEDQNLYDEYIVINGALEKVGSWGIESGTIGELNVINSVNEEEFIISTDGNRKLSINSIAIAKVGNLQTELTDIKSDITILKADVGTLKTQVEAIQSLDDRIEALEKNTSWGSLE